MQEFKQDFYPGEHVATFLNDNTRLHGIIRDKMNYPRQHYTDGAVKAEAYARYLVRIIDRPNEEALLDQDHITRDRKTFSNSSVCPPSPLTFNVPILNIPLSLLELCS